MSEHTDNADKGEIIASIPVKLFPDMDKRYPLCHMPIAMHLGIREYRAKDAAENLRRVKALFKTYRELGVTLLFRESDGSPWTEDDVTPELIARHEGRSSNWDLFTPEQFDDHLLDIIASQTGKPRVSYVHIRKHTPQLRRPCDIYQEVGDKNGEERRRVEVYLDGRHLWVEDNCEGTGETDKYDTRFPGLGILNDRPGQTACMIEEAAFEKLWEKANASGCDWPRRFKPEPVVIVLEDAEVYTCDKTRAPDSPFCEEHREMAHRLFPRLFESA